VSVGQRNSHGANACTVDAEVLTAHVLQWPLSHVAHACSQLAVLLGPLRWLLRYASGPGVGMGCAFAGLQG
jgi:hypothetical protein